MISMALLSGMASPLPLGDAAGPLPTEFRLFSAGINRTMHGDFVLDAEGAAAIMAAYERRGVDMVIDLQHDSLDPIKRAARADAADAMGSFRPQVRDDGSLWAVGVCWSAEGERRLRARLQRYTSPAAHYDRKSRRIVALLNAALCADPGTYAIAPLVAASREGAPKNFGNELLAAMLAERVNAKRKR
jgi:phage I-like protein